MKELTLLSKGAAHFDELPLPVKWQEMKLPPYGFIQELNHGALRPRG